MKSFDEWVCINTDDPVKLLNDIEFDSLLLMFGSFVCMLNNKKINQIGVLSNLLDNKNLKDSFKLVTEIDNDTMLLYIFITKYPLLCRSKIIKTKIKQFIRNDRKRKRHI